MRHVAKHLWLAAGLTTAVASNGFAQEAEQSFKTLIGKGYEIKSVTFAHGDSTENRDAFLVTLQQGKSVAVCYFASVNWINMSSASLDDARRCEVR